MPTVSSLKPILSQQSQPCSQFGLENKRHQRGNSTDQVNQVNQVHVFELLLFWSLQKKNKLTKVHITSNNIK